MSVPLLLAPDLEIFVEAARLLLGSSQELLQAGQMEADLPLAIAEVLQQAEAKLGGIRSERRELVGQILRLTPSEEIVALLQDLVDAGQGPDMESFLAKTDLTEVGLRLPKRLVCPLLVRTLLPQWDLSGDELQSVTANLEEMESALDVATDLSKLRQLAMEQLLRLTSTEQMALLQEYLAEDDLGGEDPSEGVEVSLVGPLVYFEIADHLLSRSDLGPDQRLDLQTNRAKAEARYRAMDKLGRIEREEEQRQQVREWIRTQTPGQLFAALDRFFAADGAE